MKFLFTFIFVLFLASASYGQKVYTDEIPPDFKDCKGCILVIMKKEPDPNGSKFSQKVDKKMIEFVETFIKKYEGKTAYVTPAQFESDTIYKNVSVYRYVLNTGLYDYTSVTSTDSKRHQGFKEIGTADRVGLNLHFFDRAANKEYMQLSNWAGWEKNFEKVAEALNKELKKAGG